jgi:hypothetical protein
VGFKVLTNKTVTISSPGIASSYAACFGVAFYVTFTQ